MGKVTYERQERGEISACAVVFEKPQSLMLRELELAPPGKGQVLVDVEFSGISTGTEKLLWSGQMPSFPGMGYPLVPGYETVGRIIACGADTRAEVGDRVFVSGASCYGDIRGLFGGASSHVVVDESKTIGVDDSLLNQDEAILLALSATAHHALFNRDVQALPELIIGHGVLGRLLARLTMALGGQAPVVWETSERRRAGGADYPVIAPDNDERHDYGRIMDASGDPAILDAAVQRLAKQGEIVLAGFYSTPLSFNFAPAFMREATIRIAAEWLPQDLKAVQRLLREGLLNLDNLITHRRPAADAETAYPTAFSDPECLKMVLDWRNH